MDIKLFDSELKVMEVLWREGELPAKKVADTLKREVGWTLQTTYTIIKRCIAKGAIHRTDPHFICHALIPKEQVQEYEAVELINKVFDGSPSLLVASLLNGRIMKPEEIAELKKMVNEWE